jgi:hypothetical protein
MDWTGLRNDQIRVTELETGGERGGGVVGKGVKVPCKVVVG